MASDLNPNMPSGSSACLSAFTKMSFRAPGLDWQFAGGSSNGTEAAFGLRARSGRALPFIFHCHVVRMHEATTHFGRRR